MTRKELIERLQTVLEITTNPAHVAWKVRGLIKDIEADGVLDVQAPAEIAESMKLPGAKRE